jgi:hypothetical protein
MALRSLENPTARAGPELYYAEIRTHILSHRLPANLLQF